MKHVMALFVIGGLLCGPAVIWAGDKEELQYTNYILQLRNNMLERQIVANELEKLREVMKKQGYVFDAQGNYNAPKTEPKAPSK